MPETFSLDIILHNAESYTAIAIFVFTYLFIAVGKLPGYHLDRAGAALLGASLMVWLGVLSLEEAFAAIDFNTIALLLGMMIVVACLRELHIFDWLATRLALLTRGDPILIFVAFTGTCAILSAFLDNVTTVLVLVPLIIALTRGMGLDPTPYVLTTVFTSNIGGALTLIGDPPNILIGSLVGIPFSAFPKYMFVPVALSAIGVVWLERLRNRATVRSRATHFGLLFTSKLFLTEFERRAAALRIERSVAWRSGLIGGVVLGGFFAHNVLHVEPAVVALVGAVLMLGAFHRTLDLHELLHHVEWTTLLFFSGLFVLVGAAEHTGLLEEISRGLVSLTNSVLPLILIVLWSSAIFSGIIDNIPFVAVMIPVLQGLMKTEPFNAPESNSHLLWWALVMGACFGGNATMIGASANVVSCGIANREGVRITFASYVKAALPGTILTIVISSVYLVALYYLL